MLEVGQVYTHTFQFSQADVDRFAEVTGDKNPIHVDEEYAQNTLFKTRIMHGFLGGSIFSKVFGTLFPGEGTIYMKQEMKFMAPMFVDTEYTAVFTVKEVNREKHRAVITTEIKTPDDKVAIGGEALVMNPRIG